LPVPQPPWALDVPAHPPTSRPGYSIMQEVRSVLLSAPPPAALLKSLAQQLMRTSAGAGKAMPAWNPHAAHELRTLELASTLCNCGTAVTQHAPADGCTDVPSRPVFLTLSASPGTTFKASLGNAVAAGCGRGSWSQRACHHTSVRLSPLLRIPGCILRSVLCSHACTPSGRALWHKEPAQGKYPSGLAAMHSLPGLIGPVPRGHPASGLGRCHQSDCIGHGLW
jgi:hypothetical protein